MGPPHLARLSPKSLFPGIREGRREDKEEEKEEGKEGGGHVIVPTDTQDRQPNCGNKTPLVADLRSLGRIWGPSTTHLKLKAELPEIKSN